MRYIAIILVLCFAGIPMEAKTPRSTNARASKVKRKSVKGRKAPRHSKSSVRRNTAN